MIKKYSQGGIIITSQYLYNMDGYSQDDPFTIMSQLNGTLQNLASSDKEEKMLLLECKYKSEKLKLCCREIDIMERKSEIELKLLQIQEKKQLVQAREDLKDQGIDEEEINMLLPLK